MSVRVVAVDVIKCVVRWNAHRPVTPPDECVLVPPCSEANDNRAIESRICALFTLLPFALAFFGLCEYTEKSRNCGRNGSAEGSWGGAGGVCFPGPTLDEK